MSASRGKGRDDVQSLTAREMEQVGGGTYLGKLTVLPW